MSSRRESFNASLINHISGPHILCLNHSLKIKVPILLMLDNFHYNQVGLAYLPIINL